MRRAKPRVVWLPPNDDFCIDNVTSQSGVKVFSVDVSPAAPFAVGEIPVVVDAEPDTQAVTTSLADIASSAYRLRRIVGKIWVRMGQVDDSNIQFAIVTAGLIVRRVDPVTGTSLVAGHPNGAELSSPNELENYSDPWIWRRSWLVGNNVAPGAAASTFPPFPETNEFFSGLDGPHVDQKTARIVGPEERLFLNVGVRSNKTGEVSVDEIPTGTLVIVDLRVLGSMRSSSGNRRNASR